MSQFRSSYNQIYKIVTFSYSLDTGIECRAGWVPTGSLIYVGEIPPQEEAYFNTAECVVDLQPGCDELHVFGYVGHTHFLGQAIWVEHYRPDSHGQLTFVCSCLLARIFL